MNDLRQAAIALYDRFTHEGMDRRVFMAEMTRIAGSAAAASALVSAIAASPAAAATVPADDPRLRAHPIQWDVTGGRMMGYQAAPIDTKPNGPIILVIHENRGLNEHIRDVTRRLALAGFTAIAPDFLSPIGGTPADEDEARAAIGKLDLAAATALGVATVKQMAASGRKVGVTGFCWGGAMTLRLAVGAGDALAAAVPFYGPAPDPAQAAEVKAPVLMQLAGLDERVNTTAIPFAEALKAAGKDARLKVYEGVNHAFHNDTSAERYNEAAAKEAWALTLGFFAQHLRGIVPPERPAA